MVQPASFHTRTFSVRRVDPIKDRRACDTSDLAAQIAYSIFHGDVSLDLNVEHFGVIALDTKRRITGYKIVATGTQDTVHIHFREVFRAAVILDAWEIIVFHNHPSGDPTPSQSDLYLSSQLIRAGKILQIPVLDHIVLGDKCWDSAWPESLKTTKTKRVH